MKEEELKKLDEEKIKLSIYLELFIHQIKIRTNFQGWNTESNLEEKEREKDNDQGKRVHCNLGNSSEKGANEILVLFFFSDYPPLKFSPSSCCQSTLSNRRYESKVVSKSSNTNNDRENIQDIEETNQQKYPLNLLNIFEFEEGKRCKLEVDSFLKDDIMNESIDTANFKIVGKINANHGFEVAESENFSKEVQSLCNDMKDTVNEICFLHFDDSNNASSGLDKINHTMEDKFDYQRLFQRDSSANNFFEESGEKGKNKNITKSEEKRFHLLLLNNSGQSKAGESRGDGNEEIGREEENEILGSMEVTIRFTCDFSMDHLGECYDMLDQVEVKALTPNETENMLTTYEILKEEEEAYYVGTANQISKKIPQRKEGKSKSKIKINSKASRTKQNEVHKKTKSHQQIHSSNDRFIEANQTGQFIDPTEQEPESFQIDPITMGVTYVNNASAHGAVFPPLRNNPEKLSKNNYISVDHEALHASSQPRRQQQKQKQIITLKEIEGLTLNTVKEISQPKPLFFVGEGGGE